MNKVVFLLCLFAFSSLNMAMAKDWYLIGEFCNWNPDQEIKLKETSSGVYTVTVPRIEGEFKFRADKSWDENLGALDFGFDEITGNGSIQMMPNSNKNFNAPGPLKNVTFKLITKINSLRVSGLSKDQRNTPSISKEIPTFYLLDSYGSVKEESSFQETEPGVYSLSMYPTEGVSYILSSVYSRFGSGFDDEVKINFLKNYQLGKKDANSPREFINLNTDIEVAAGNYNYWSFDNFDLVNVTLDTNTMILHAEKEESQLYICGRLMNEAGVENNFIAPSVSNKEFYDDNFKLTKWGNMYFGTYWFAPVEDAIYLDNLPCFRFFTALLGWKNDASLGSTEEDFHVVTVPVEDYFTELPIVKKGLGNWAPVSSYMTWNGGWIYFEVDLDTLTLKMIKESDGTHELTFVDDASTEWYTIQGYRIDKPVKGLNIQKKNGKTTKVFINN